MNTKITGAFSLALEIEGLLQLALNRGEMLPAEALPLLKSKANDLCAMINSVTTDDIAAETVADTPQPPAAEPEAINIPTRPDPAPAEPEVKVTPAEPEVKPVTVPEPPSRDLAKRLTLNDRFRFRRELFHNSVDEMNQAFDIIESMNSVDDVFDYLTNDLCLDENNVAVVDFISFIESNFKK